MIQFGGAKFIAGQVVHIELGACKLLGGAVQIGQGHLHLILARGVVQGHGDGVDDFRAVLRLLEELLAARHLNGGIIEFVRAHELNVGGIVVDVLQGIGVIPPGGQGDGYPQAGEGLHHLGG